MRMERYSRQILFTPIGEEGQRKLAEKHVLIIGLGTLGTQSAEMLTRAGVGKLTIVDRDYIEWSNLQRQQLYTEEDAKNRTPKAIAAAKRLRSINSEIEIVSHVVDVTPEELENLVIEVDLILDATDNFDIRMMINDMAIKQQIPWIFGSCVGSYGMSFTIIPHETPCLHCLLETVPIGGPTCDTAGIISPAASQVVVHQTTEALKILTENEQHLRGKLISFDLWTNQVVQMNVASMKKADCPSCGSEATYPYLSFDEQMKTAILCGRQSVQIRPPKKQERDLGELAVQLKKTGGKVETNPFLLSYTIGDERMVIFKDGRALIHGTNDIDKARTLYHRYFS
ncbi:molybdopterin/thiamine biosynthesis adenylyltransferase [Pseudogracilibacillus auburnensis]|uniref:Molybdopterin/thiamine biosynthesis adenylyltransferase n=1 Tax=Pseudogracilibacillus auburnensis TaxID=1494959 RepID=A0A2V3VZK8_9BACI|nr:thiazole biosynthesis adenylyltransferase ThiF [Pseudogracilibacillus auburnensis]PXW86341.1 molybdopterin/thiamine biosynthesis adenylyltransferase [Pseudogracilibacillus auburnensis]